MAKLFAEQMVIRVEMAMRMHGGVGFSEAYPLERHFRDCRSFHFEEGNEEIQKPLIARAVLSGNSGPKRPGEWLMKINRIDHICIVVKDRRRQEVGASVGQAARDLRGRDRQSRSGPLHDWADGHRTCKTSRVRQHCQLHRRTR